MYAFHYLDAMWPASYVLHYSVPIVLMNGTFAQVYGGSLDDVYRDVAQTIANRDPNGIIRLESGSGQTGRHRPTCIVG